MQIKDKILFWDDERNIGNSLIVTLQYGYRFEEIGEHVRGFDTVKEAKQAVWKSKKCNCQECVQFKNN